MKRSPLVLCLALGLIACSPAPDTTAAPAVPEATAPAPEPAATADPALTAWLADYTRNAMAPLRYVAKTTGEGDQQMILIYLIGPEYCGSGGCDLLVLRRTADGFETLGDLSIVNAPIRVLQTSTNGRPDLAVQVSGDGVQPHEALIPFDGARYASNPSVPPARRVDNPPGTTLITDDDPGVTLKE